MWTSTEPKPIGRRITPTVLAVNIICTSKRTWVVIDAEILLKMRMDLTTDWTPQFCYAASATLIMPSVDAVNQVFTVTLTWPHEQFLKGMVIVMTTIQIVTTVMLKILITMKTMLLRLLSRVVLVLYSRLRSNPKLRNKKSQFPAS
jgi:hypothetical protein